MILYATLSIILSPFFFAILLLRVARGKEEWRRIFERLGFANRSAHWRRNNTKLIWIHAASVGEINSAGELIENLSTQNIDLLITTGTVTSAAIIATRLKPRQCHQYIPIDSYFTVRRFLQYHKPNVAIFIESELWPNLIHQTANRCPLLLISARISARSCRNWYFARFFTKSILGKITICYPQTRQDQMRFRSLSIKTSDEICNLKLSASKLPTNKQLMDELTTSIGSRRVWIAVSTHQSEEVFVAKAAEILRQKHPDLLTIIAPRHPNRLAEIEAELSTSSIAIRSRGERIDFDTQIYIADTLGELGTILPLAKIVFMGGSLVSVGGHNPLEPARFGCAIISGNLVANFSEIYENLEVNGAATIITNIAELADCVDMLLSNEALLRKQCDRAYSFATRNHDLVARLTKAIIAYSN